MDQSDNTNLSKQSGEVLDFQTKNKTVIVSSILYIVFRQFGKAKLAYSGSILSSSQFLLLPQRPLKTMLTTECAKNRDPGSQPA